MVSKDSGRWHDMMRRSWHPREWYVRDDDDLNNARAGPTWEVRRVGNLHEVGHQDGGEWVIDTRWEYEDDAAARLGDLRGGEV